MEYVDGQDLSAIVKKNGVSMAFLAYCSVLQPGYAATATRPCGWFARRPT